VTGNRQIPQRAHLVRPTGPKAANNLKGKKAMEPGYTDTLEVTYCNHQPAPQGFAKVIAKHPGGGATYENHLVAQDGTTVQGYMDRNHPGMIFLSIRPVPSRNLPATVDTVVELPLRTC
jgi:hypothetical protein